MTRARGMGGGGRLMCLHVVGSSGQCLPLRNRNNRISFSTLEIYHTVVFLKGPVTSYLHLYDVFLP